MNMYPSVLKIVPHSFILRVAPHLRKWVIYYAIGIYDLLVGIDLVWLNIPSGHDLYGFLMMVIGSILLALLYVFNRLESMLMEDS
jgi:hypothetical protein